MMTPGALTMPSLAVLFAFTLASLAILVVPGPSVVYVVTRSVAHGRRAGLWSMLGLETGAAIHVAAATVGLAGLVSSSEVAFNAVRWAGVGYLVWLALREFSAVRRSASLDSGVTESATPARLIRDGILVDVLNPKTATFFLAFLPQFVSPSQGSAAAQLAVLGLLFVALAGLVDSGYVALAGRFSRLVRGSVRARARTSVVVGSLYLVLAAVAFAG